MHKLSKEDIGFIDNYLKNMEVNYVDIRVEMTDHIASEIEAEMQDGDSRGFYPLFKEYMLKHKSDLAKNYRKFKNNIAKKMVQKVFHNLFCYKTLSFVVPAMAGLYTFLDFFASYWTTIHLVFTWGVVLVYFLPHFLGKKKYSYLHMAMICCGAANYMALTMFQHKGLSPNFIFWYAGILVWFNAAVFKTVWDLKTRYNGKTFA